MFGEVTFRTNGVVVLVIRKSNSRTVPSRLGFWNMQRDWGCIKRTHIYFHKMTSESFVVKVLFLFLCFQRWRKCYFEIFAWTFISFQNEFAYLGDRTMKFSIKFILVLALWCLFDRVARSRWKVVAQALSTQLLQLFKASLPFQNISWLEMI